MFWPNPYSSRPSRQGHVDLGNSNGQVCRVARKASQTSANEDSMMKSHIMYILYRYVTTVASDLCTESHCPISKNENNGDFKLK